LARTSKQGVRPLLIAVSLLAAQPCIDGDAAVALPQARCPSARSAAPQRTSLPSGDPSPTYDVVTPIDDESRSTALHYLCSIPRYGWCHAGDFAPYMEQTAFDQGRFFLPELAMCGESTLPHSHYLAIQVAICGAFLRQLATDRATSRHPSRV
jgi:hypothetical protein